MARNFILKITNLYSELCTNSACTCFKVMFPFSPNFPWPKLCEKQPKTKRRQHALAMGKTFFVVCQNMWRRKCSKNFAQIPGEWVKALAIAPQQSPCEMAQFCPMWCRTCAPVFPGPFTAQICVDFLPLLQWHELRKIWLVDLAINSLPILARMLICQISRHPDIFILFRCSNLISAECWCWMISK